MSFADDFRSIVVPRLRAAIRAQAFFMALDDDSPSYSEAHAEVMAIARRFGATHLPGELLVELDDWIGAELLKAIVQAEARITGLDTAPITDPVAHYRDLAASCSDPERMRWTFASICPEYRAYLLAERRGAR